MGGGKDVKDGRKRRREIKDRERKGRKEGKEVEKRRNR